ncbi:pectate lyase [Thalassoglobus sp. JC818]|uniref:pectate lyase n=1 Tax=Thalassoglobus sp. JC818 TaxID=3232136 RepID=UPI003458B7A2
MASQSLIGSISSQLPNSSSRCSLRRNETARRQFVRVFLAILSLAVIPQSVSQAQDELSTERVEHSLYRAVRFFREKVGVSGGYVYQVSDDLSQREGENAVGPREAWVEVPGTPAVGMAYLQGYQKTRNPILRDAMLEVADALVRTQLETGGWANNMEFDPLLRPNYAYRVDHRSNPERRFNRTTLDDGKSQACLTFLMLVDKELEFSNERIHEAAQYALDSFRKAQYPNGAWPQQYDEFPDPSEFPVVRAKFPKSWEREYKPATYRYFYTLNDNTICDVIQMMLLAHAIYEDDQWRQSAIDGGDFLLLAQLPEPQPGWAQQYNHEMEPVWARKFEPPALTGGESQGVLDTLLTLYEQTGEEKFIQPVSRAIEFYRSLELSDGQLARFYEIGSNKPLYFTRDYELVYTDDDLPTHYGFKVSSKLDRIESRAERLSRQTPQSRNLVASPRAVELTDKLIAEVQKVVDAQDNRGAWVEDGAMRNADKFTSTGVPVEDKDGSPSKSFVAKRATRVISTKTFMKNLNTLVDYLAAVQQQ